MQQPQQDGRAFADTEESETHHLTESSTTTLSLEQPDRQYLQSNWDEISIDSSGTEVTVTVHNRAGLIGLPSGAVLRIDPKLDCNILHLLGYAGQIDTKLLSGQDAGFDPGESFVTLIGRLYRSELQTVLQRGLVKQYERQQGTKQHVRGQIQVQKQLQTQGPVPTSFECEYSALTRDVPINRAIRAAVTRLSRLVDDRELRSDLQTYRERLATVVSAPDSPQQALRDATVSRRASHYSSITKLTRVVLQEGGIRGVEQTAQPFPSFTFETPSVFEDAVVDAVRRSIDTSQYRVTTNDLGVLVRTPEGGSESESRRLEPDIIIRRRGGPTTGADSVVAVGDAKWKVDATPSMNDLYQIATYQAKAGVPGFLVYPVLNREEPTRYEYESATGPTGGRGDLHVIGLYIGRSGSFSQFKNNADRHIAVDIGRVLNAESE